MPNTYTGQTLTDEDLQGFEVASVFTNCIFNDTTTGGDPITKKNLGYAKFDGCTFNTKFENCNLMGVEGDSPPQKGSIAFVVAPENKSLIYVNSKLHLRGDGSSTSLRPLVEPTKIEIEDSNGKKLLADPADYSLSGDEWASNYNAIPAGFPADRNAWLAARPKSLKLTASSTSIVGDGVTTSTLTVQKQDADGNDLTAAGDSETITIKTTRGKLDAMSKALVNGTITFTVTSVSETVDADFVVSAASMASGRATVTFTP